MIAEYLKKYFTSRVVISILFFYFIFLLLLQISVHWRDYSRPFRKDFLYTLYYHSQWVDPESKYGIGDDGLYQVAGHTLATKHEFFTINPEMPPLAKYLYGYSILFFGNGEAAALLFFCAALICFYFVAKQLIQNAILQITALIFFITDPLLFGQSFITLLDLPQLLFLLMHVLVLFALMNKGISRRNERLLFIIAGVTLGLFISVKIAFLSVIILLADLIVLIRLKKIWFLVPICIISAVVYISAYCMYFIQGHSLIEFLKNQKWMVYFYLSSNIKPVYGTVFTALFFGKIIGWSEQSQWTRIAEWTILWSAYLILFCVTMIRFILKKTIFNTKELYLLSISTGLLVAFCFLPFFTRYLVLVLPFLIIFFIRFLEKSRLTQWFKYSTIILAFCIHYYIFWSI